MKKTIFKRSFPIFLAVFLLFGLGACSDDVNNRYAHERAFLKFAPVTGVPMLSTAVNSLGTFCTIQLGTSGFIFRNAQGQTSPPYPYTAEIQSYGQPECIAGFVVGKSSIPDMNLQYPLVAYELACPNCYEKALITKPLTLSAGELLTCSRCNRVYDLKNDGNISKGDEGVPLYRYRTVSYAENVSGGVLIIVN